MQRIIIEVPCFYIICLTILHSINYFRQNVSFVVEKISVIYFNESGKGTKLVNRDYLFWKVYFFGGAKIPQNLFLIIIIFLQ